MRCRLFLVCLVLLHPEGLVGRAAPSPVHNQGGMDLPQLDEGSELMELSEAPQEGVQNPYYRQVETWSDEGHHPEGETYGDQADRVNETAVVNLQPPRVSDVGVHHCTVSWLGPVGTPVAGYRVNVLKGDAGELAFTKDALSESELAIIVDGLTGNTKYTFQVAPLLGRSFTPGKVSDPSGPITTKIGPPSQVGRPVTSNLALRSVKLSWGAPSDDGGAPITGYRITLRQDHETEGGGVFYERIKDTKSATTSVMVDSLRPDGHVYEFKVEAINSMGNSVPSQASDPLRTLYATTSGHILNFKPVVVSESLIRLFWDPPADTGAKPTGYKITYQPHAEGPFRKAPPFTGNVTKPEYDMHDLDAGTKYRFRIRAINRVGNGLQYETSVIQTKEGVPGKFKEQPSVGFVTDTSVTLEWTKPREHGSKILGYQILMQSGGVGGYTARIEDTGNTDLRVKITGLEHGGTEYQFKVRGINAVGVGRASPPSEPIQTLNSYQIDTARAVQRAHDEFKAHNQIHELWKLKMENERYNKNDATQKRIVANAQETAMKSRKLAKTTRLRLDIEKRMCRKKIDMADEYGRKAVRLTTDKLRKIAALNDMKWNKRLNIINKQWDNKLVLNRGSALKQLKKLGVKLDKKWSAKLNEQKNKLTAEAETVQSSLNDQLKEAKDQTARSQKDAMERLKQTVQDWQSKLDAQASASAIASNRLKSQVSSLKLQVIELKNQADEAKDKGVPLPSAKVEMDKLHEMRKQLQNVLKSKQEEQDKHMLKLTRLYDVTKSEISDLEVSVKQKAAQFQSLEGQLNAAEHKAAVAKQNVAEAGVHRPSMFLDLGESLAKVDEKQQKDLVDKELHSQRKVKEVRNKAALVGEQKRNAEIQLANKKATATAMKAELRVTMEKVKSLANGTESQKTQALVALVDKQVQNLQQVQIDALNRTAKQIAAGFTPVELTNRNFDEPCANASTTMEDILLSFPASPFDFDIYLKEARRKSIKYINGGVLEQKKVLESCEMQKNCIALGGSKANCNIKTMCSSGNPANGTRPCKTCASMFKLQKWKQLHPTDVKSQCGSNECHPTPMTWRLCSTTDNATVCPEAAINVKPALVPDSDVADSHCTSCFEGDSLEIVHPATQTGFCRSNGPADGSAMIAPPRCHSINDLVPNVSSPVQVCTQIQRPHVVIPATPADGWLKGYNEYTYATCNSRKVLVCKPSDDPLSTLVRPASGGPKEYQSGITQCNTESAVRCVTACRLHLDGTICKKGEEDKCRSNTSWNYTAWQKARDKLLEKPQNLEGLDCDAARCTNQMCESLALHV